MKTKRMSFSNIKDVLTRDEMRSIMAGSDDGSWTCRDYKCPEYPSRGCFRTMEHLDECNCRGEGDRQTKCN